MRIKGFKVSADGKHYYIIEDGKKIEDLQKAEEFESIIKMAADSGIEINARLALDILDIICDTNNSRNFVSPAEVMALVSVLKNEFEEPLKPKESKLKPCPFCGEKATILYDGMLYGVMCYTCLCEIGRHGTKEKAAEAWNRRV